MKSSIWEQPIQLAPGVAGRRRHRCDLPLESADGALETHWNAIVAIRIAGDRRNGEKKKMRATGAQAFHVRAGKRARE